MLRTLWRTSLTGTLAALLCLTIFPGAAQSAPTATTRYVATDGTDAGNCTFFQYPCRTINYAIGQATGGDTIYVFAGTYAEAVAIDKALTVENSCSTPCILITPPAGSYGLTFSGGVVATVRNVTVDGAHVAPRGGIYVGNATATVADSRLRRLNPGSSGGAVRVTGSGNLTLQATEVLSSTGTPNGGGVYNQGSLSLVDSLVGANTAASNGGGIYNSGSLTVQGGAMEANQASGAGGGLWNSGNAAFADSTIAGNEADDPSGSQPGGGIYNSGNLEVAGGEIRANYSRDEGGGIYNGSGAAAEIVGATIADNQASYGGGIYNVATLTLADGTVADNSPEGIYSRGNTADLTVQRSSISGNSARGIATEQGQVTVDASTLSYNLGGGLRMYEGTLTIHNSTIAHNITPLSLGAGLQLVGPDAGTTAELRHVTVWGNEADDDGGGIFVEDALVTIYNSIVAGNTAASGDNCAVSTYGGTLSDYGTNIADDASCSFSHTNTDPLLGPLQLNGGPTETMLPAQNSPAVDAGSNSYCDELGWDDQRNLYRPQDGNGDGGDGNNCDVGAVERQVCQTPGQPALSLAVSGQDVLLDWPDDGANLVTDLYRTQTPPAGAGPVWQSTSASAWTDTGILAGTDRVFYGAAGRNDCATSGIDSSGVFQFRLTPGS